VNAADIYGCYFTITLHHGGRFTNAPGRRYVGGKIDNVDLIDIDKFSVHEVDLMMGMLNYIGGKERIFYHFLIPNTNLDVGLHDLSGDADVLKLAKYVSEHKIISVYTEHGISNVYIDMWSPKKNITIEEIDQPGPNAIVLLRSNAATTLNDLWQDSVFGQSSGFENSNVIGQSSGLGESSGHFVEDCSDNEDGSDSDEYSQEDDSDDSDYIVDESCIDDVEVDMRDYKMHVDVDVGDTMNDDPEEVLDEVVDNDEFDSLSGSDEDMTSVRRQQLKYLRKANEKKSNFYIGQMFGTKEEVKALIKNHAVETRRDIRVVKDDGGRLRAECHGPMPNFEVDEDGAHISSQPKSKGKGVEKVICKGAEKAKIKGKGVKGKTKGKKPIKKRDPTTNVGGRGKKTNPHKYQCPWVILVSPDKTSTTWMVKTLNDEHKCLQTRSIYACTTAYMANKMVDQYEENPEIPVRAVQEQFQRRYEIGISRTKAYRARAKAKQLVQGDHSKQYEELMDYVLELQDKNPGTTVKIDVELGTNSKDTSRVFKRIYVCFGALKNRDLRH